MALKTNLISHWKCDETSGDLLDGHGSNNLTDTNTVTGAAGKVGTARQFTAANSEYFTINDNASLSTGDIDFTIAMWIYLDSTTGDRRFFSKTDNTDSEYNLFYRNSTDRIQFDINSGSIAVAGDTLGSPADATWYFVVAWHDSVADTVNIQINNGTVDSAATANVGPSDTAFALQIGRLGTAYMDGRLDEIAFWKRTLSAAERTQLYNGGNGLAFNLWDTGGYSAMNGYFE